MARYYLPLVRWARSRGSLHGAARRMLPFVPDVPITMHIPELGRFCFGLRRHRWLMGNNCLAPHALILGMFQRLTRPGDVFYDVGANIGYYTRFIVRHLPVSRVVAFEPMRANVRILKRNIALGRCADRVTLLPIALGDSEGEEDLQVDDIGDGSAVLDRISGGQPAEPRRLLGLSGRVERTRVERLDDVIRRLELPPPNVIKIDTEGAEVIVLRGAQETLRRHRPRLAIALHGPERARETLELLEQARYAAFGYVRTMDGEAYRRLGIADAERLSNNNIIASTDGTELCDPIIPFRFD
jgi:FkbM family methyltransferase